MVICPAFSLPLHGLAIASSNGLLHRNMGNEYNPLVGEK